MKKLQNWEIATNKFLEDWKNKKDVIGIIICGSYITGNPSKHSDVDIQIILDNKVNYRERGNKIINGMLIEYFANPLKKLKEYEESDFKSRRKVMNHMLATGKVVLDKTGEIKKLVAQMKKQLNKKYPKMNKTVIEITKYHIWDMKDNLEEVYKNKDLNFQYVYYNQLNDVFEKYTKYLQTDYYTPDKQQKILISKKNQKKYCIQNFPDKEFKKKYLEALKVKNKKDMLKKYIEITNYALKKWVDLR
ncbi:MAG: nucleotidyltransferase domain-containing protein [Candidatus Woesearchaeota archaeon]